MQTAVATRLATPAFQDLSAARRLAVAILHIPAHFRQYTSDEATVEVPGGTLRQVIDALDAAHPGMRDLLMTNGRVRSEIAIAVNSTITENGLLELVPDDAEVHLIPSIAGG